MHYPKQLCACFLLAALVGTFSPSYVQTAAASAPSKNATSKESDPSDADLHSVTNYIFWCAYSYDKSGVAQSRINGVEGMSDHGYTHELRAGGAISVFADSAVGEKPQKDFLDSVRGCKKNPGYGLFRHLYLCEDRITGSVATTLGTYTATYYKDAARTDWRWDWDAFRLVLETFRLIDGAEFGAMYRTLYPGTVNPYGNAGPHGKARK